MKKLFLLLNTVTIFHTQLFGQANHTDNYQLGLLEQLHYFIKKKQPKARLKAIAEVLLTLKNSGYHCKELRGHKQLPRLSSNKGWHIKQNLEPEMIWFDEWVNTRLV